MRLSFFLDVTCDDCFVCDGVFLTISFSLFLSSRIKSINFILRVCISTKQSIHTNVCYNTLQHTSMFRWAGFLFIFILFENAWAARYRLEAEKSVSLTLLADAQLCGIGIMENFNLLTIYGHSRLRFSNIGRTSGTVLAMTQHIYFYNYDACIDCWWWHQWIDK